MQLYCVSRGIKRPDIVKKIDVCLVVIGIKDVWKMEPNLHTRCNKIKIFKKYFIVDRLNVQMFCKKAFF